ncbi:MAG: tyrosine-type recombinase/integrase [Micrococcus sp.]|nr:tyrosine-type recombinase/integrase [Micrococcus sp.]
MRVVDLWHRKDRTRTARYGQGKRWQAIWTEHGNERKRSFDTRDAATGWLAKVAGDQARGEWVTGDRKSVPCGDLFEDWLLSTVHVRSGTLQDRRLTVKNHLQPKWGRVPVGAITRSDLQGWVGELSARLAPRTVDTIWGRMTAFLNWCAAEQYITSPPTQGVKLPKGRARPHRYLTVAEYRALRAAMHEHYQDALDLAVTAGLRPSELWELRVQDVDLPRRRLVVSRGVSFTYGRVVGAPKSNEARWVPITKDVAEMLEGRVKGKKRDDLVFTTVQGAQVRENNFVRRYFTSAVTAAGLDGLVMYDLRHTCASWAVAAGASVKTLQRMLGHKSAAITLDTYAGLFDQDLDDVAVRIGKHLADTDRHKTATENAEAA